MTSEAHAIFHLSFPVSDLKPSLDFYQRCLGATVGRRSVDWADVILFGHQLTLHEQPSQVLPRAARGVRHFGAILSWEAWESVRARVLSFEPGLSRNVYHRFPNEPGEHAKLLLEDPDAHLIEIKAYRDLHSISAALDR